MKKCTLLGMFGIVFLLSFGLSAMAAVTSAEVHIEESRQSHLLNDGHVEEVRPLAFKPVEEVHADHALGVPCDDCELLAGASTCPCCSATMTKKADGGYVCGSCPTETWPISLLPSEKTIVVAAVDDDSLCPLCTGKISRGKCEDCEADFLPPQRA